VYSPTANELKVLKALRGLREGDGAAVGSKVNMGSAMADYLCRYLTTKELVQRAARRYTLTPVGQKALEEAFARILSILKQKESDVVETLAKIRLP